MAFWNEISEMKLMNFGKVKRVNYDVTDSQSHHFDDVSLLTVVGKNPQNLILRIQESLFDPHRLLETAETLVDGQLRRS